MNHAGGWNAEFTFVSSIDRNGTGGLTLSLDAHRRRSSSSDKITKCVVVKPGSQPIKAVGTNFHSRNAVTIAGGGENCLAHVEPLLQCGKAINIWVSVPRISRAFDLTCCSTPCAHSPLSRIRVQERRLVIPLAVISHTEAMLRCGHSVLTAKHMTRRLSSSSGAPESKYGMALSGRVRTPDRWVLVYLKLRPKQCCFGRQDVTLIELTWSDSRLAVGARWP